ncbi:MAG TPA: hypothetical protein VF221_04665 [Chloroflexota bacterium]
MRGIFQAACALVLCGIGLTSHAPPATAAPLHAAPDWLAGWSMNGHDPQRTNRSPATGPLQPHLIFQRTGVYVRYIAPDGNLYGGISEGEGTQLQEAAFSPTGGIRWSHLARVEGQFVGLGPTGTVFQIDNMQASGYSARGKRLWKTQTLGLLKGVSPLVTGANQLYAPIVGPHGYSTRIGINIVSGTGNLLQLFPGDWRSPAMSLAGVLYLFTQSSTELQARSPTGALLWQVDVGGTPAALLDPLVGKDGTVYVGNGTHLVAVTPDGQTRWTANKADGVLALAERADGSILSAGTNTLDAFSPDGTLLWSVPIGQSSDQLASYWPSLIVDAAGTAYVGSGDGIVRVISSEGKLVGQLPAGGHRSDFPPQVLLGADGRLIVNGSDDVLQVYGS